VAFGKTGHWRQLACKQLLKSSKSVAADGKRLWHIDVHAPPPPPGVQFCTHATSPGHCGSAAQAVPDPQHEVTMHG
jgi:hypothetical protein